MPHANLVEFLLDHNKKQSELFSSSDVALARRQYRQIHPTEIAALKCMDGRLHLAVTTKTPFGIIQPFRTIGGMFDTGSPFGETFDGWVKYSIVRGRSCLVLVTYHFSKGDHHRGCAGHGYDTEGARAFASKLLKKIERIYGAKHAVVYPILTAMETDEDALILFGKDGSSLNTAEAGNMDEESLRHKVESLFPDMTSQMLTDLMPLLRGNIRHIGEVRSTKRPIAEAEHKEQVIAVGRGFDWLHFHNKALIIGPFSFDMASPIGTAGKVVLSNLEAGRIPNKEGVVLLTSAIYRDEVGPDRLRAQDKARTLAKLSLDALSKTVPDLIPHLKVLAGTVNMSTRLFTPINLEDEM